MKEKKYVDMDGMQERVDKDHQEHLDKEWDKVIGKTEKVIQLNQEAEAIWDKSFQIEVDEEQKRLIAEMEKEKDKAIKEIEDKYKTKGMKNTIAAENDRDADLRAMLKGLNEQAEWRGAQ